MVHIFDQRVERLEAVGELDKHSERGSCQSHALRSAQVGKDTDWFSKLNNKEEVQPKPEPVRMKNGLTEEDMKQIHKEMIPKFIEKQALVKGLDGKDRSTANVRLMYEAVEPMLYPPKKNGTVCTQNRWRTVVPYLHEQKKKEMKK